MLALGCRALKDLVNAEIENRTQQRAKWSSDDVLRALDFADQELWNVATQATKDHQLDSLDVNVAAAQAAGAMTAENSIVQGIREWRVPETVGVIRRIENTTGTEPRKIDFVATSAKDASRAAASMHGAAFWIWSKWSNVRGLIGFVNSASIASFRVWYIRRPPPLHYGTARSGLDTAGAETASTASRIWLDKGTEGAGELVQKDDIYRGSLIRFNGTPAATTVIGVTDQVRMLTSGTAVTITSPVASAMLWTFDELLTINCATFFYELVPQAYPEHYRLLILIAARQLLQWAQAMKQVAMIDSDMPRHMENFEQMVTDRQRQDVATVSPERRLYG